MKDSAKLGALIGLGYFFIMPSLWGFLSAIDLGAFSIVLMYALGSLMFIIPIVLYIKGYRKAMKAYLLTLFIPTLAILLLFGSCMMFLGIK